MTKTSAKGHSIKDICRYVKMSPQAYYKRIRVKNEKAKIFQEAEKVVIASRAKKSRVGLRTIWHKEGLNSLLGLNQFEKEMSFRGFALKRYKSRIKTTNSRGHHYKFDNLIAGINVSGENQVIVGDITYYENRSVLYYVFHFVDYYTLELKGLVGDLHMQGVNAEKCLRQVFRYNSENEYNHQLILHTDAGGQYRSDRFQQMLNKAKIRPSHARNCFENGLSERENGIIKNEYLVDYDIKSVAHLNTVLSKVKHQVNKVYPSKVLGYRTPKQFAAFVKSLPKAHRPIKTVKVVE